MLGNNLSYDAGCLVTDTTNQKLQQRVESGVISIDQEAKQTLKDITVICAVVHEESSLMPL